MPYIFIYIYPPHPKMCMLGKEKKNNCVSVLMPVLRAARQMKALSCSIIWIPYHILLY